jgi:hypothetical protein
MVRWYSSLGTTCGGGKGGALSTASWSTQANGETAARAEARAEAANEGRRTSGEPAVGEERRGVCQGYDHHGLLPAIALRISGLMARSRLGLPPGRKSRRKGRREGGSTRSVRERGSRRLCTESPKSGLTESADESIAREGQRAHELCHDLGKRRVGLPNSAFSRKFISTIRHGRDPNGPGSRIWWRLSLNRLDGSCYATGWVFAFANTALPCPLVGRGSRAPGVISRLE